MAVGDRRRVWRAVVVVALLALLVVPGARAQGLPEIREFATAHFSVEQGTQTPFLEQQLGGEGEVVMPDQVRVTLNTPGQTVDVIQIGTNRYERFSFMANPEQWYVREVGESLIDTDVRLFNRAAAIDGVRSLTLLGEETVGGVPTEHYRGEFDTAALAKLGLGQGLARSPALRAATGATVQSVRAARATFELWIARDTRYIVQQRRATSWSIQMALAAPTAPGSPPGAPGGGQSLALTINEETLLRFIDFDRPVTIIPPSDPLPFPSR